MIVTEHHAKSLLARCGLTTPQGRVACTAAEAATAARDLGGAVVVKALIPVGGRGKAGGVLPAVSPAAAEAAAGTLLGRELLGHTVREVLVEQAVRAEQEIYAGVVVNAASGSIDLVVSLAGGVEIEVAAQAGRGRVLSLAVEPGTALPLHRVRGWLEAQPLQGIDATLLAATLVRLFQAAADLDAVLLEVNPLALAGGALIALDCKLEVDDNALFRQPEVMALYRAALGARERRARELGVSFVPLQGDIGLISSGAGLGMATLDLLQQAGLRPADFLDTGGGISEQLVKGAVELIMEPPEVRGALINLYGGINRMLEAAKGIAAARETVGARRPLVVKVLGNQQEEAWAMLEQLPNVHVIRVTQTEVAVARLAELVG